ncbi:MAG: hypothetical protein KDC48_11925 [Planctomycetes bacterium]|nr:hypothetical protein [Planctomycetota bacterium]
MAFGFFAAAACFFVAAARMEVQRPGLIAVGGLNFMLACAALLRRRRFAAHRGATPDDRIREDAQR